MKYIFGSTPAAKKLEILLEANPIARRKISKLLSEYSNQLMKIVSAKDPATVRLCWELLRDYTLRRIDVKSGLSNEMRSYAKNVVICRHRVHQQNFDLIVSCMKRKGLTFPEV